MSQDKVTVDRQQLLRFLVQLEEMQREIDQLKKEVRGIKHE